MPRPSSSPDSMIRAVACVVGLAVSLAGPRPAPAGDGPDRAALLAELDTYLQDVAATYAETLDLAGRFVAEAARCRELVDALGALGTTPDELIGPAPQVRFRDAAARCHEYEVVARIVAASRPVQQLIEAHREARAARAGVAEHGFEARFADISSRCVEAIAGAHAAGFVDESPLLTTPSLTLGEVAPRVCEPFLTWLREFGPANRAAWAARDSARARLANLGVDGDRLRVLLELDADGPRWLVRGCRREAEPKRLARAAVLWSLTVAADGRATLRRVQFKGNELVSDTRKEYLTQGLAMDTGCR